MYYLLLDGAQAGPFTLAQLIEMWQARRVTPVTLYWEEGNPDWLPLHNIAALMEVPAPAATPPAIPPSVSGTTAPFATGLTPSPAGATASNEEVLFDEHPTLWNWTGELALGVLLTVVLIGIVMLIHVFWSRNTTRYRVTNKRVAIETGIFTRHSRELRIEDIRSIAARSNLFGIGDVEFSSAARDDAEVTFAGISRVERVRDLVKQLQNTLK
jgi:membrane protein YdbS with pleckstrin-like domain